MKSLILALVLVSTGGVLAQPSATPIPKAVLLGGTNATSRMAVVLLSADAWRQSSPRQNLVVTNPKLISMSAGSVSARKEDGTVSILLHDVTVHGPFVVTGESGGDQTFKTRAFPRYVYSLAEGDFVQVNGELLTSESFWQRYKNQPRVRGSKPPDGGG
jgi:hypothetical protein